MKFILLILLGSTFSLFCNAGIADSSNETLVQKTGLQYLGNKKEPFTGVFIERDRDKKIKYLSEYNEGERHGSYITFSQDGLKVRESVFHRGVLTTKITYHANGMLEEVLPIIDDMAHGSSITYYDSGRIKSITEWREGRQHGESQIFDYDGSLKSVWTWNEGRITNKKEF